MPPRKPKQQKIRKLIKSELNKQIERKRQSQAYAATGIGTAANAVTSHVYAQIAAGTSSAGRIGHIINATGFYAQFVIKVNTAAALNTQVVRIVLVEIKGDQDSTLYSDALGVASVIDADRYNVLYDRMISFTKNTDSGTQRVIIKRKLRNKRIRYDAGSGNPVNNGLYLYLVSDDNTNKPTLDGHYLIHYKDA